MKKYFLIVFITFLFFTGIAQVKFEEGYFIDNTGIKTTCLIKNSDWGITPKTFDYKKSLDSPKQTAVIDSIREFAIKGGQTYIRFNVDLEKVVDNVNLLNQSKRLLYQKDTLFLKVLIAGKESLFVYEEDKNTFFYKNDTSKITQIIYKQYLKGDRQIAENVDYKQQLYNSLKCDALTQGDFEDLTYDIKSLTNIFRKFNLCSNYTYVDFNKKVKKDLFNLNIRSGLNYSSLLVTSANDSYDNVDFGNKATFKLGLEAEILLGFGGKKWAIPFGLDYQYFNGTANAKSNELVTADVKEINTSFGLRYYLFLNNNSKLFVNGLFNYVRSFDSKIQYSSKQPLRLKQNVNMMLGFGYKLNDRYSAEFRYETKKDVLNDYLARAGKLSNVSLTFGYTLF